MIPSAETRVVARPPYVLQPVPSMSKYQKPTISARRRCHDATDQKKGSAARAVVL